MALKFFESYMNSIYQDPVDYWQELRQQSVDDTWIDSSTLRTLKGQNAVGLKVYSDESLQLNSVIDVKTGKSLGDDYRKIIYKNLVDSKSDRFLGKYYLFDDNYWLTINTNTVIGSMASAILQRCNNTLKWYDTDGVLHVWDCVFERSLNATNFDSGNKGVQEVQATTIIKVQLNAETGMIEVNQRFLFNAHAFQVKQINNHISDTYLELYMFEVQVESNDDIVNNIANAYNKYIDKKTETILLPSVDKIRETKTQDFNVYKYIDGVKQDNTFTITVEGAIVGVNYTLNIIDGNNFSITNLKMSGNPVNIVCVDDNDSSNIVTKTIMLGGIW